jgi:hypothetical protein
MSGYKPPRTTNLLNSSNITNNHSNNSYGGGLASKSSEIINNSINKSVNAIARVLKMGNSTSGQEGVPDVSVDYSVEPLGSKVHVLSLVCFVCYAAEFMSATLFRMFKRAQVCPVYKRR